MKEKKICSEKELIIHVRHFTSVIKQPISQHLMIVRILSYTLKVQIIQFNGSSNKSFKYFYVQMHQLTLKLMVKKE